MMKLHEGGSSASSDVQQTNGAAVGKRTLTEGLVQRKEVPKAKAAAAGAGGVPAEVMARVGATFWHGTTKYQYEITSSGGFKILASPNGKGKGIEFTTTDHADAWKVLSAYVIDAAKNGTIPATVKTAEPTAPVAHDDPKKPADDPWSFGGLLSAASDFVSDVVDTGLALIAGGLDIIEGAIDRAIGGGPSAKPGEKTGGETHTADPTTPKVDDKTTAPVDTGPSEPATIEDMPAMSQFRWYGNSFEELGVDAVFAAAKLIGDTFGFGGTVTHVTEPDDKVRKKNPNQGYWWFKADGKPAWDGNAKYGATQYVTFTIADGETSSKVNPVSAYLAENAPGKRPAKLHIGKADMDVPAEVQNLALRNIPGPRSCFATSAAMMAQAGVHAGGSDMASGILPISGETYRDYTDAEKEKYTSKDGTLDEAKLKANVHRDVTGVTVNSSEAAKAKAYIDFEVDHGRPVFTGITYKESTLNSDGRTDHWVVISGRSGANEYTFNDPGVVSSKEVAAAANKFVWDGEKLHKPLPNAEHLYVVAWIRPNIESAKAWAEHWAKVQAGADTKTDEKAP